MSRTRKLLRTLSALALALVLYAAVPHVHAEPDGAGPVLATASLDALAELATRAPSTGMADSEAAEPAANGELVSDDAHESHSSTAPLDEHPCALCRNKAGREVAAPAPLAFAIEASPARRIAASFVAPRVELLLVRRHPARGPPLA